VQDSLCLRQKNKKVPGGSRKGRPGILQGIKKAEQMARSHLFNSVFWSELKGLLNGFAVDLDLDIVVQIIDVIAVAIQADVSGTYALGINEFALVGLDVVHIFSHAQPG